jgi:hypothetical protein
MTGDFVNATRQLDYLLNNPSCFSLNILRVDPVWKILAETSQFKELTRNIH